MSDTLDAFTAAIGARLVADDNRVIVRETAGNRIVVTLPDGSEYEVIVKRRAYGFPP